MQVTLFHYRKTGNRSSPILLGLEVPASSEEALRVAIQVSSYRPVCMLMVAGCRHLADWRRSGAGILQATLLHHWLACMGMTDTIRSNMNSK